jgi:hypothetical protein
MRFWAWRDAYRERLTKASSPAASKDPAQVPAGHGTVNLVYPLSVSVVNPISHRSWVFATPYIHDILSSRTVGSAIARVMGMSKADARNPKTALKTYGRIFTSSGGQRTCGRRDQGEMP